MQGRAFVGGVSTPNLGLCPNPSPFDCGRHLWAIENQNNGTTEAGKDLKDHPTLLDVTGKKDGWKS